MIDINVHDGQNGQTAKEPGDRQSAQAQEQGDWTKDNVKNGTIQRSHIMGHKFPRNCTDQRKPRFTAWKWDKVTSSTTDTRRDYKRLNQRCICQHDMKWRCHDG